MSATLHADVDPTGFYDEPLQFLSEHGMKPSQGVTMIRDSDKIPDGVKDDLRRDVIIPEIAIPIASQLLNVERKTSFEDEWTRVQVVRTAAFLLHWASAGIPVKGMH